MNNDLISRQAAIKATWQDTGYTDPFNVMTAIRDRIKQLPPIQPVSSSENPNSSDAISRQDALEAFGLSEKTRKYGGDHSGYDTMMMYEIQDTIEDLPPIQPKRGKWILAKEQRQEDTENGNYMYNCSNCGYGDLHSKAVKVSYCWNCGAKMEVTE